MEVTKHKMKQRTFAIKGLNFSNKTHEAINQFPLKNIDNVKNISDLKKLTKTQRISSNVKFTPEWPARYISHQNTFQTSLLS